MGRVALLASVVSKDRNRPRNFSPSESHSYRGSISTANWTREEEDGLRELPDMMSALEGGGVMENRT